MKNIEKIKEDISVYTQLLESHGVTKLYEGNTKNGNQVLMADGNSGVVFSIEYVPATHNVEIRTSSNQTEKFPTYEILNSLKDKKFYLVLQKMLLTFIIVVVLSLVLVKILLKK